MNNKLNKILVIAGPTGSGESTVTKKIMEQYSIFKRLVTATTRAPREREKNKRDYYFFSEQQFKREIAAGNIIEYQNTRNGVYYGSYKPELENKLKRGYNIIVNPDIVGAKFYKRYYGATTIFIMPDSFANLEKRLRGRDKNATEDQIQARLKYARQEVKQESPFYDYIVVNKQNKIDETVKKVIKIIKKENYLLLINKNNKKIKDSTNN